LDLLGVRKVPFLSRSNYYYELTHLFPWSILAGVVEGQFAGVVISKTFHGSSLLIAVATATPFAAYVFSLIWGMLCVGRPKMKLAMTFGWGTALCAALIGAIPNTPFGAVWFVLQMALAQVLLAGVVTVRSAIWRSNYPADARGRIAARLQFVRSVISVLVVQASAALCDRTGGAYRVIFPSAAVCGVIGVALLLRGKIRGERRELRSLRAAAGDVEVRARFSEPFGLTALMSPGHVFGQMFRILRRDRRFLLYCAAQTLLGVANLMTISIVVAIVTRELAVDHRYGFWISTTLISALPILSLLGSLRRWGLLFDSLGVLRFRVVNVVCWALAIFFGLIGTLLIEGSTRVGSWWFPTAVTLFALRGILHGLGQGGGSLAWNLGHLHFAKPEEAEVYMGIHVFLAGVRGLIAPLGGMWLWSRMGWPVWLAALLFALAGLAMFSALARKEAQLGICGQEA